VDLRAEYSGESVTGQANGNYCHTIVTSCLFRVLHAQYLISICQVFWGVKPFSQNLISNLFQAQTFVVYVVRWSIRMPVILLSNYSNLDNMYGVFRHDRKIAKSDY
jgi:hypothetical protein